MSIIPDTDEEKEMKVNEETLSVEALMKLHPRTDNLHLKTPYKDIVMNKEVNLETIKEVEEEEEKPKRKGRKKTIGKKVIPKQTNKIKVDESNEEKVKYIQKRLRQTKNNKRKSLIYTKALEKYDL